MHCSVCTVSSPPLGVVPPQDKLPSQKSEQLSQKEVKRSVLSGEVSGGPRHWPRDGP